MRKIGRIAPVAGLVLVLAGCGGASPTGDWVTGKDVLGSLRESGFECEWTGSGEQVVFESPFSAGGSETPVVRCDGYGIALLESRQALLDEVARGSDCESLTAEDRAAESAEMPVVVGGNFIVFPAGEFPGVAQPEDFVRAFGGEAMTLLDLYEEACPDSASASASASAAASVESGSPPGGLVDIDGVAVPALALGDAGPVLEVWLDPQAPAAGALAVTGLPGLVDLVEQGRITLVFRPAIFLDRNLGNDSSRRAIGALGCAMEQGAGVDFLLAILSAQPAAEGAGWSDEELVSVAESAGLDGEVITTCVTQGRYLSWVDDADSAFTAAGVLGVPYAEFDGAEVPNEVLADPRSVEALLTQG